MAVTVTGWRIEKGKSNDEARARYTQLREEMAGKETSTEKGKKGKKQKKSAVERLLAKPMKRIKLSKSPRATVLVNQPVYTQDEDRFFTHEMNRERKELFWE